MNISTIVMFAVGFAFGAGVVWLFLRTKSSEKVARVRGDLESQVAVLNERISTTQQQLDEQRRVAAGQSQEAKTLQASLQTEASARAAAERECQRIQDLQGQLSERDIRIQSFIDQVTTLTACRSELEMKLVKEAEISGEKLALLQNAQEKLTGAFKALSSDALRSNNTSFLELATTTLAKFQEMAKGELDNRKHAQSA
jgi:DNA recombination protein RmuC